MDSIPLEYIYRRGADEIARYFRELIIGKMVERKVAVMVEDYTHSLFFVDCDQYGLPTRRYFRFLTLWDSPNFLLHEDADPCIDECKVTEKEITIDRPIAHFEDRYDFPNSLYVFMWQGRVTSQRERPVEELDVKQLLRLARSAVESRDGLIIDEVLKNRQIK